MYVLLIVRKNEVVEICGPFKTPDRAKEYGIACVRDYGDVVGMYRYPLTVPHAEWKLGMELAR